MNASTRWALALVMVLLAGTAAAFDAPLHFAKHGSDRDRQFHPFGSAMITPDKAPPPGDWRLPDLSGENPRFATVELGDQSFLMILAKETAKDWSQYRLYFDVNHDRNLTNDPMIRADGSPWRSGYIQFPPIDLTVNVGHASLPYSLQITLYGITTRGNPDSEKNFGRNFLIRLAANCSYSGEFEADGRKYRVVLGDSNGNGRFGEKVALQPRKENADQRLTTSGDSFYISSDERLDYYMAQKSSEVVVLAKTSYTMELAPDCSKLTFTPLQGPLVTVKLGSPVERMLLCAQDGGRSVALYRPGAEAQIPAGSYRIVSYQVIRNDEQGDAWRLNAEGMTNGAVETLTTGAPHTLIYGEPYKPSVRMVSRSRTQSSGPVSLDFRVFGAGREQLSDLSHISGHATKIAMSTKDSSRPKEPTFRIVADNNEVVTSGSFEYG